MLNHILNRAHVPPSNLVALCLLVNDKKQLKRENKAMFALKSILSTLELREVGN